MSSSSCFSTNRTSWYRHNIFLREEEEGGGGWYGTSGCVTGLRGDLIWGFTTVWWSSCVMKIQEPLRGFWGCLLQCTMKLCRDTSPHHADHQLESTPWTRPEGGLSKLWIGKCEDQPCAAALCRASDDAERRLSVIRQCYGSDQHVFGSATDAMRPQLAVVTLRFYPALEHVRAYI